MRSQGNCPGNLRRKGADIRAQRRNFASSANIFVLWEKHLLISILVNF